MAYSDYGAFVYLNGKRMEDYEDAYFNDRTVHGLIDDRTVQVVCYKQGLPSIFYNGEEVEYCGKEIDCYDFEPFKFEMNGYAFSFADYDKPYVVEVVCPNGDIWRCEYDYWYGAGF